MAPIRTALAAAATVAALVLPPSGARATADANLRILAPADGSFLSSGKAVVIGKRKDKAPAMVRIEVNGKLKQFTAAVNGGIHATVPLSPGKNVLRLVAGPDHASVTVSAEGQGRPYRYHPEVERCESCHGPKGADYKPPGPAADLCYRCHRRRDREKYVHGPVGVGNCTACHDPHGSALASLQSNRRGCFDCHEPFPGGGLVHKPASEGLCNACHDPHSGQVPHRLVRGGNALCLDCHRQIHPRHRSRGKPGVMTKLPEGFPMDGEELACGGCHAPHRSSKPKLMVFTDDDPCGHCHGK